MSSDRSDEGVEPLVEPEASPQAAAPGTGLATWGPGLALRPDAAGEDLGPGIVSTQALEPGYYWTAREDVPSSIKQGQTLLLIDVHEVHGKVHTVDLLMHPGTGRDGTYSLLVDDFLAKFDPQPDADRIRAEEQQAILNRVSDIQQEMARTQADPQLMIAAVSDEVERRIKESEREAQQQRESDHRQHREKAGRLDKIHRRAARRSAAAGNPLVVARAPTGTNLANYIAAGVNETGVAALREEASRQVIVAGAQAKWLQSKTEEITRTLKMLAPYAAEKAQVALARSSGTIKRARAIEQGIKSLDLYTLKGVDVFDVRTGAPAPSSEPLTLVQGKRFQDEELAVFAEVGDDYDYKDQHRFFTALREDHRLVDQLFPTTRCVVSMAVTRHLRSYENPYEEMMANQANQLVYLMVRNGDNVHVVYSSTPSHEASQRLFPTEDELGGVFTGIDGTKLSLRDVEFSKATADFNNLQLHYKRFLILLCGLDHQHKLMGDFYPQEKALSFMSLAFQQQYMRFFADDEQTQLLTHLKHPWVGDYMREKNLGTQPGSRVFIAVSTNLRVREAAPELARRTSLSITAHHRTEANIVQREGLRLYLACETHDHDKGMSGPTVKVYLDGKDSSWWLCIDDVKAADIQSYIHSRRNRAIGVGYLRLFKRLHEHVLREEATEAPARAYLLEQATMLGGLPLEVAAPAVDAAVRNWRAARRGRELPGIDELAELNTVLDLVIPEGYVPEAVRSLIDEYVLSLAAAEDDPAGAALSREPLLLTRTGKNRFHLYTTTNAQDRSDYPDVLPFQWVRRVALEPSKTVRSLKTMNEALVWLPKVIPASESVIQEWPKLKDWQHEDLEPIRLRKYAEIKQNIEEAAAVWGPILKAGAGAGIEHAVFDALLEDCAKHHRANKTTVRKYNYFALPVGILRESKGVATIYMTEGMERVLHAYGSDAQRAAVQQMLRNDARWYQRSVDEYLKTPLTWRLRQSAAQIDKRHDTVLKDLPDFTKSAWSELKIRVNDKRGYRFGFMDRGERRKGDGKPRTNGATATLSLNRAVEELMGVGPLNRRAKRREVEHDIKNRSLWMSYPEWLSKLNRGSDHAAFEAGKRRWLHELRTTPFPGFPKANLSALLWDAAKKRGVGNAYFIAPLRPKTPTASDRHSQTVTACATTPPATPSMPSGHPPTRPEHPESSPAEEVVPSAALSSSGLPEHNDPATVSPALPVDEGAGCEVGVGDDEDNPAEDEPSERAASRMRFG